jgi:hypothetical protein
VVGTHQVEHVLDAADVDATTKQQLAGVAFAVRLAQGWGRIEA